MQSAQMADSEQDTWDELALSNELPARQFSTTITFKDEVAAIDPLRETHYTDFGFAYTLPQELALSDLFRRALIEEANDPISLPYAGARPSDPVRRAKKALGFVRDEARTFPTSEEFAQPFTTGPPTYNYSGEFISRTSKWRFEILVTAPPRFGINFEVLKSTFGSVEGDDIKPLSVNPDLYTRGSVIYNVDRLAATTIDAEGYEDLFRSALTSQNLNTSFGRLSLEELSQALSNHDYYPGPMQVWATDDSGNTVSISGRICQVWPDPDNSTLTNT